MRQSRNLSHISARPICPRIADSIPQVARGSPRRRSLRALRAMTLSVPALLAQTSPRRHGPAPSPPVCSDHPSNCAPGLFDGLHCRLLRDDQADDDTAVVPNAHSGAAQEPVLN